MPSNRFTWSRPTTHIYSYNREAQNIMTSRNTRATSYEASKSAAVASAESSRTSRAASVAAADTFAGYSGYYGRQLMQISQTRGPTAAAASVPISASLRAGSPAPYIYPSKAGAVTASAALASTSASAASMSASRSAMSASSTSMSASRSTTIQEKTSSVQKVDFQKEHSASLDYGRQSQCRALRRAEMHAVTSGKDPRHTVLPRNLGDDICKVVADLHGNPYESKEINSAKASYSQGRLKVERMEKELHRVTDAAMSYKSLYAKSASQMAREAIEACEMEAVANRKVRRTVVEETTSRRQVAAA